MVKKLIAASLIAVLAACQTPSSTADRTQNAVDAGATQQALNYYVLVRAADTNLIAVADDGKDMFFEFALVVPAAMQVFDLDGQKLNYGRNNNLLAVSGLHRGILLRIGQAATFVSIRPGAIKPEPTAFVPSPELTAVRDQLERNTPWYQAMEQAIAKSEAGNESYPIGGATNGPPVNSAPSVASEVATPRPRLLNKALPRSR